MAEWFQRTRRIAGRKLDGKSLPAFVYRQDERDPQKIVDEGGFKPWGSQSVALTDHVRGTYSSGPNAGSLVKFDSEWVSTSAWRALEDLDNMSPVMLNRIASVNLYKIDTELAGAGEFSDVNDAFDRAGLKFDHRQQREWTKKGIIPAPAIVSWMPGAAFYARFTGSKAPDENSDALPWQRMPERS